MADIDLSVNTQDNTSEKFRAIGRNIAEGMREIEKSQKGEEEQTKKSELAWAKKLLTYGAAAAAAKKLWSVSVDAFKAYAEEEESIRKLSAALTNLGYDSAALTPMLVAQAEAFKRNLAVSDDTVRSIQQLLIRFNVAPKDIQATTKAVLDYSAATGQDAESATMALMRALERGGQGLGKLGIRIKETNDFATNLNNAVAEMGRKFGGAAEAAAGGLSGQLRTLENAQEDLTEAFGLFLSKTGIGTAVIDAATRALNSLTETLTGESIDALRAQEKEANKLTDAQENLTEMTRQLGLMEANLAEVRSVMGDKGAREQLRLIELKKKEIQEQQKYIDDLGQTEITRNARERNAAAEREKTRQADLDAWHKHLEKSNDLRRALNQQHLEEQLEAEAHAMDALAKIQDKHVRDSEKRATATRKIASIAVFNIFEDQRKRLEQEQLKFAEVGDAIGGALINGINTQLGNLANGGEFDIANFIFEVLGVALTAVLTAYGVPAPLAGLAGTAIKSLGKMMTGGGGGGKKYHDGGAVYADDALPRFHEGGEVPAVLQDGEHVLSRADVARMGGHERVEEMKQSAGPVNIYIQAMDARSFEDFIAEGGGGALVRNINSGRGEFAHYVRRLAGAARR